jgi:hypothetical protein
MKNSNDGNRISYLVEALRQPTAPPRAPFDIEGLLNTLYQSNEICLRQYTVRKENKMSGLCTV